MDEGSQNDKASILLSTKKRRWIRNVRMQERLPEAMRVAERIWHAKCPGITTRSLSATYNCFGMVFASRRTWIMGPEELDQILNDDGYRRVNHRGEIMTGDIIVYRHRPNDEITHVGVIVDIDFQPDIADLKLTVMSQWGRDGEYIHLETNVPKEYGQHREYYTERRVL